MAAARCDLRADGSIPVVDRARNCRHRAGARIATMPDHHRRHLSSYRRHRLRHVRDVGRRLARRLTMRRGRGSPPPRVPRSHSSSAAAAVSATTGIRGAGDVWQLPAGELHCSLETKATATSSSTAPWLGHGPVNSPGILTIRDGRSSTPRAISEAGCCRRWIAGNQHGRAVAELGIGTNPAARIGGKSSRMRSARHDPRRVRYQPRPRRL
jgi:hypothetical protein